MAKSSQKTQLEEVRSLLHELQRIRSDNGSRGGRDAQTGHVPGRPEAAISASRGRSVRPVLMAGAALLLVAAAIAIVPFLRDRPGPHSPEAVTAAIQQPEPSALPEAAVELQPETGAALSLLRQAQQMMVGGDILQAREILMNSADAGPPDVALALARSYDPNFLQSVTDPNAGPDVEQATLWYRRWHQAAVEQGLVTDAQRLDRILRSMH
jgi:hypothetical protein